MHRASSCIVWALFNGNQSIANNNSPNTWVTRTRWYLTEYMNLNRVSNRMWPGCIQVKVCTTSRSHKNNLISEKAPWWIRPIGVSGFAKKKRKASSETTLPA